jgi:hypothetical protein
MRAQTLHESVETSGVQGIAFFQENHSKSSILDAVSFGMSGLQVIQPMKVD